MAETTHDFSGPFIPGAPGLKPGKDRAVCTQCGGLEGSVPSPECPYAPDAPGAWFIMDDDRRVSVWLTHADAEEDLYTWRLNGKDHYRIVPVGSTPPLALAPETTPPPCIRCGGPTALYGQFHTTEWNCKDAEGCGSYVLMSDRIGTDGTKVEPSAAQDTDV